MGGTILIRYDHDRGDGQLRCAGGSAADAYLASLNRIGTAEEAILNDSYDGTVTWRASTKALETLGFNVDFDI